MDQSHTVLIFYENLIKTFVDVKTLSLFHYKSLISMSANYNSHISLKFDNISNIKRCTSNFKDHNKVFY